MFGFRPIQLAAAGALIAGITVTSAQAQDVPMTGGGGIFIGGSALLTALHTDKYISDTTARTAEGAGAEVQIGWESDVITPFIGADIAHVPRAIGSYRYFNLNYGARVRLSALKRFTGSATPYIEAAISNPYISQEHVKVEGRDYTPKPTGSYSIPFPQTTSSGIMKSFGAGLQYRKNRHHDMEIGFAVSNGAFDSIKFAGGNVDGWDFRATTLRFHVGINWHPFRT